MKIVIDIDEDYYEIIKHDVDKGMDYLPCVLIAKGAPLPKGHGRLIDADKISFSQFFDAGDYAQARRGIYEAPTIIEADKESEE